MMDGSRRAGFRTFPALRANFHLKNTRIGKMGDQIERSFFRVVLLEQVQRTSHQTSPASGTLRAICIKAHISFLIENG